MKQFFVLLISCVGLSGAMVACGSNSGGGNSNTATVPTVVAGSYQCSVAGYYNTQYGCLAQSSCAVNQAMYGSTCVQAILGGQTTSTIGGTCQAGYLNTQYGCMPQGSCPANTASYNNTCVTATASTYGTYGSYGGTTALGQGQCPVSYVQTQYGCLPQSTCPVGQGMYNNLCITSTALGTNGQVGYGGYYGNTTVVPAYGYTYGYQAPTYYGGYFRF